MIPKEFDAIVLADVLSLAENRVPESRTLEYKRELPKSGASETVPFLAEICAFANTSGGDLVFGLEEDGGVPTSVPGVEMSDPDSQVLRLESIVRSGISPRLGRVSTRTFNLSNGRFVVLMRIARSWNGPHCVTINDHGKFYARSSAGKYPMDVSELRMAFTMSAGIAERIRQFRRERLVCILDGETPIALVSGATLVLHIIPLSSFTSATRIDLLECDKRNLSLPPLGSSGWDTRPNLEGIISFAGNRQPPYRRYTQLHRSGIVEGVTVYEPYEGRKGIPVVACEQEVMDGFVGYLGKLQKLGVQSPLYLMLSLVGAKGYVPHSESHVAWMREDVHAIARDVLEIPEVVLERVEEDLPIQIRPLMDMLANALGFEASSGYDAGGTWRR